MVFLFSRWQALASPILQKQAKVLLSNAIRVQNKYYCGNTAKKQDTPMHNSSLKQNAANAALEYIQNNDIVGVGCGSTVAFFIQSLAKIRNRIEGAVASSQATQQQLEASNIPVIPLNQVSELPIYIDGADEIDSKLRMIKGGGAALTGEKIVSSISKKFICICEASKQVQQLGKYPVPIEVIDLAQSLVARKLIALGATPQLRMENKQIPLMTEYKNRILDVSGLKMDNPCELEKRLSQWPGIVTVGLFCCRPADILILGYDKGIKVKYRPSFTSTQEYSL